MLATDAGTVLSTGNAIYNVNGANGIAIAVEGGAQGTIDAGATINLNAAGAIAGVVDGQAHDLAGANAGTPVATTLTNHAAVTSSTAGVTGFVAQNLGTLENRDTVLLTGAGSTGVVIGTLGTVNNASTIRVSDGTGALVQVRRQRSPTPVRSKPTTASRASTRRAPAHRSRCRAPAP